VQERANYIAEWLRLTGEVIGTTCPNSSKPGPKGVNSAAARELGIDHKVAQRAKKISKIKPEAKAAARAAGLDDNQSALMRIASEPSAEKQLARIRDEQQKAEAHKTNRAAACACLVINTYANDRRIVAQNLRYDGGSDDPETC